MGAQAAFSRASSESGRQPLNTASNLAISPRAASRARAAEAASAPTTVMSMEVPSTWSSWKRWTDAWAGWTRATGARAALASNRDREDFIQIAFRADSARGGPMRCSNRALHKLGGFVALSQ